MSQSIRNLVYFITEAGLAYTDMVCVTQDILKSKARCETASSMERGPDQHNVILGLGLGRGGRMEGV